MAELYHVGVEAAAVPATVILVDAALPLRDVLDATGEARALGTRREYRSHLGTRGPMPILVTSVGIGAPPLAIAVEELSRAGATTMILLAAATFAPAATVPWILPVGATREEGTSAHYAPVTFPAVPDPVLFERLRVELSDRARCGIVRTVDVVTGDVPPARALLATDTRCAALFVVAAARRVAAAAVLLDAAALEGTAALTEAACACLADRRETDRGEQIR